MSISREFDFPDEGPPAPPLEDPIFHAVLDAWAHELVSGEEIPDALAVSFLRSTTRGVTADSFKLLAADRQPIDNVTAPGKSANISFTPSPAVYSLRAIGRHPRTDFALADILAEELRGEGFHTLYAPLYCKPLHVRVVHDLHFRDPESQEDVPRHAREALANIFNRELQRNRT